MKRCNAKFRHSKDPGFSWERFVWEAIAYKLRHSDFKLGHLQKKPNTTKSKTTTPIISLQLSKTLTLLCQTYHIHGQCCFLKSLPMPLFRTIKTKKHDRNRNKQRKSLSDCSRDGMSDPNMETKRFHWWIVKSLALSHVAPVHEDLRGN